MKIVLGVLVSVLVVLGGINLTKKDDGGTSNKEASVEAPEETTKEAQADKTSSAPAAEEKNPEPEKQETVFETGQPKDDVPTGDKGYLANFTLDRAFPLKKDDRFFIDAKGNPLSDIPEGTRIIGGKPVADWDQKLLNILKTAPAFSRGDISITKLDKKFIIVNGKTGFPVETADIKFTAPDGAKMSYNAFVNGANGEMMLFFNTKRNGVLIHPDSVDLSKK